MADYKDKLKGLKKTVKTKKSAPIQEVAPVQSNEITRATLEMPTHMHTNLKRHLAGRGSLKEFFLEAIIEKAQSEGVEL